MPLIFVQYRGNDFELGVVMADKIPAWRAYYETNEDRRSENRGKSVL